MDFQEAFAYWGIQFENGLNIRQLWEKVSAQRCSLKYYHRKKTMVQIQLLIYQSQERLSRSFKVTVYTFLATFNKLLVDHIQNGTEFDDRRVV